MTPERGEKLLNVLHRRQANLTVLLENVFDPHNVSAVLRTCDAVGIQDVYILNTRIAPHKRWGFKSSSSAYKWITTHQFYRHCRMFCCASAKVYYHLNNPAFK